MIRALEILFLSGIRPSQLLRNQQERFCSKKYALDPSREVLRKNIRARTERMFAQGWVEEVGRLISIFPDFEKMPAARSLGYAEILKHLKDEMSLAECIELVQLRTRQYAKRQATWFRNQDGFQSLPSDIPLRKIIDSVLQWYRT